MVVSPWLPSQEETLNNNHGNYGFFVHYFNPLKIYLLLNIWSLISNQTGIKTYYRQWVDECTSLLLQLSSFSSHIFLATNQIKNLAPSRFIEHSTIRFGHTIRWTRLKHETAMDYYGKSSWSIQRIKRYRCLNVEIITTIKIVPNRPK